MLDSDLLFSVQFSTNAVGVTCFSCTRICVLYIDVCVHVCVYSS